MLMWDVEPAEMIFQACCGGRLQTVCLSSFESGTKPQPQSQGKTEAVAQHGIHHHGMGMLDQNDQKWPIFLVDQKDDLSKFLYVPLHRIQIIQETHQNTVVSVSF